jgi:PIN domain nuclease of toxin-antitoxin system
MILLDTNAIIFLQAGNKRARPLEKYRGQFLCSPVSLLELRLLEESGRLTLPEKNGRLLFLDDPQFPIDEISMTELVLASFANGWTRDVFDRLIVAHADIRRIRLATSDQVIIDRLPANRVLEL